MELTTFSYRELDAIAKSAAIRFYQTERNSFYEKNWEVVFEGVRFYCDGTRAI